MPQLSIINNSISIYVKTAISHIITINTKAVESNALLGVVGGGISNLIFLKIIRGNSMVIPTKIGFIAIHNLNYTSVQLTSGNQFSINALWSDTSLPTQFFIILVS
jgi:hypothetical protein